jgi:hypothetical protein
MPQKRIPEEYIHYVWQYGLFQSENLRTKDGDTIEILRPGLHNHDSGPDFSNARIRIGSKEWAGNVEIHFASSDWDMHGHQYDAAYDSVILHVVIHHDKEIRNSKGATIPTFSLSKHLSIDHFRGYEQFLKKKTWVPCQVQVQQVEPIKWTALKERMALERMEKKAERILSRYSQQSKDWEEVTYELLARAFGGKVNSAPFEHLTRVTPLSVLRKHSDACYILDALFLGQAGFISEDLVPEEDYEERLQSDYYFLQHKYDLHPMDKVSWKHARLRPASAPQIRIVQFARLWSQTGSLHALIMDADTNAIKERFSVELEGYWSEHIAIQKPSSMRKRSVGDSLLDRILINVVAPMRFAYGIQKKEQSYTDSALSLLEDVVAEDNSIIRKWKDLGVEATHALDSQGLLQLKSSRCDEKKCLSCSVGQAILR